MKKPITSPDEQPTRPATRTDDRSSTPSRSRPARARSPRRSPSRSCRRRTPRSICPAAAGAAAASGSTGSGDVGRGTHPRRSDRSTAVRPPRPVAICRPWSGLTGRGGSSAAVPAGAAATGLDHCTSPPSTSMPASRIRETVMPAPAPTRIAVAWRLLRSPAQQHQRADVAHDQHRQHDLAHRGPVGSEEARRHDEHADQRDQGDDRDLTDHDVRLVALGLDQPAPLSWSWMESASSPSVMEAPTAPRSEARIKRRHPGRRPPSRGRRRSAAGRHACPSGCPAG